MPASPTVFNHATAFSYASVTEARTPFTSGRALVGSRPGDVIQIEAELEPELPAIRDHYDQLGIHCADEVIVGTGLDVIAGFPDADWSMYMFGDQHHELRPNAARLTATRTFDRKNAFIAWCRGRGFPVPATEVIDHRDAPRPTRLALPAFVKASWSLGGYDVVKCHTDAEKAAAIARINGDYQVQEVVDASGWLNVLYSTEDGAARHIVTTEQVLEGPRWKGARFPARWDPRQVTDPIADALAEEGLEGFFGIDVAALGQPGPLARYLAVEVNPRTNASTYFRWTAERVTARQWLGSAMPTRHRTVEAALGSVGDLVLDHATGSGLVLTNWGSLVAGRVGLLIAGDEHEQEELLQEAIARLR